VDKPVAMARYIELETDYCLELIEMFGACRMQVDTVHDLRRSCITNWARELPIHVVQKLAGHSDIRTTQKYYLSIQAEDIRKAQRVQAKVLGKIPTNDLTDPKLTHSGQKRAFPGRKAFL